MSETSLSRFFYELGRRLFREKMQIAIEIVVVFLQGRKLE